MVAATDVLPRAVLTPRRSGSRAMARKPRPGFQAVDGQDNPREAAGVGAQFRCGQDPALTLVGVGVTKPRSARDMAGLDRGRLAGALVRLDAGFQFDDPSFHALEPRKDDLPRLLGPRQGFVRDPHTSAFDAGAGGRA